MPAADGTIRIDTKIDSETFNAGVRGIEASVGKVTDAVKNLGNMFLALMVGRTVFDSLLAGLQNYNLLWSSMGAQIWDLNWAFKELQGAWANLLATLIQGLLPYIIQFVHWLMGIVQYVTVVIAALFGLKQTIGDLVRSTDMLAAFDKINRLSKDIGPAASPPPIVVPADLLAKVSKLKDEVIAVWNDMLKFLHWDTIWADLKQTWDDIGKGNWEAVKQDLQKLWYDIGQIFTWQDLWTLLKKSWDTIGKVYTWGDLWSDIKKAWDRIGQIFTWDDLRKAMGDLGAWLKKSWDDIGKIWTWDMLKKQLGGLGDWFKTLFNHVIDLLNGLASKMAQVFNGLMGAVNTVGHLLPGFTPIPSLSVVPIPHLATGAVIPPNSAFRAVLGDQKSGVNIETPLDTMIQAFQQALANSSMSANVTLNLDGETIYRNQQRITRQRGGKMLTSGLTSKVAA